MNKMNTYIYTDHQIKKVVFICEAESILAADKKYKQQLNKDVTKQPYVGCQIKFQKG